MRLNEHRSWDISRKFIDTVYYCSSAPHYFFIKITQKYYKKNVRILTWVKNVTFYLSRFSTHLKHIWFFTLATNKNVYRDTQNASLV